MIPHFRIIVTIDVACGIAGCFSTQRLMSQQHVRSGDLVPEPALPAGWRVVGPIVICSEHTIVIKDRK